MMDLDRFARNPFLDTDISRDEIVAFTADALPRLAAQDAGGTYAEVIALVAPLFEALGGQLANESAAAGIRQARTRVTGERRRELQEALSKLEALTHVELSRGSADYVEVFPAGLSVFHDANLDGLNDLVAGLLQRAARFDGQLWAARLAAVESARAAYAQVRGAQTSQKAAAGAAGDERRTADAALRDALFHALLAVADANRGKPERVRLFFSQTLLEERSRVTLGGDLPGA